MVIPLALSSGALSISSYRLALAIAFSDSTENKDK
jgi:hypothetical protein